MKYTITNSRMLSQVGYDPAEQLLEVHFRKSGVAYQYFGVPQEVFKNLLAATSVGAFMRTHIMEKYYFRRMTAKAIDPVRNLLRTTLKSAAKND